MPWMARGSSAGGCTPPTRARKDFSPELWRDAHVLRLPADVDVLVAQDLAAGFGQGRFVTFGDLDELLSAVGANRPNVYWKRPARS